MPRRRFGPVGGVFRGVTKRTRSRSGAGGPFTELTHRGRIGGYKTNPTRRGRCGRLTKRSRSRRGARRVYKTNPSGAHKPFTKRTLPRHGVRCVYKTNPSRGPETRLQNELPGVRGTVAVLQNEADPLRTLSESKEITIAIYCGDGTQAVERFAPVEKVSRRVSTRHARVRAPQGSATGDSARRAKGRAGSGSFIAEGMSLRSLSR